MQVRAILGESMRIHGLSREAQSTRVAELLNLVDWNQSRQTLSARVSGGQRQRIGIARALSLRPNC